MTSATVLTPAQRFWKLLKPDHKDISNIYVYAIFNGLVNLSLPLGIQAIINFIQGGQVSTSWIILVVFVVLGVAIAGALQIMQLRITENLQQKIFTRASFEFAYRIPKIRMEALYKEYAPELMNRFFDTISVQKGLSKILIDFSSALLMVVFGLALLSLYHPFFIIFSLVLILVVYAIFRFTWKRGLETSLVESKHKYRIAHWLEELARTHITFKLAGNTKLPLERSNDQVGEYIDAREKHFKILVTQYSLMVAFKVLIATGLLAIGGILVIEQQMNIGQFVAAEIIILLIMSSVEKLILSLDTIYDVLTSLEKIGQVTDLELESAHGMKMEEVCTDPGLSIRLKDVDFVYPDNNVKTLDALNLSINAGERLVITGENGSGKSTLLYLLAGLFRIQNGSLSYNGISFTNMKLDSLRSAVGDCFSQEQIFEGTVLENISMGQSKVDFESVKWAVKNLKLENFINNLPEGYETQLDPEGKRLPGNIIQKLLIARSIVHKPKLLLLENVMSDLAEKDKKHIVDFLLDKSNGWTLVASSLDPYLIQNAEKVIVMKEGQIVESISNPK